MNRAERASIAAAKRVHLDAMASLRLGQPTGIALYDVLYTRLVHDQGMAHHQALLVVESVGSHHRDTQIASTRLRHRQAAEELRGSTSARSGGRADDPTDREQ